MPVKVQCPKCEKVLKAPDRARGKAIKCPECGKAVRVPVARPVKRVAAPPPSSSVMIANLDLDRIQDSETRICPKCGVEVGPEDIECPECHVDLETGVLSEQRRAERNRKGPDPKLYYKEFLKDGIEFWKKEKWLCFRLGTLWAIFATSFVACAFMYLWCVKPVVRDFWVFLAAITLLIPPGLCWNLHTTIIDATMRKKKKVGKYTFDKFLGAALGLALLFWFVDVAAPLHIATIVFLVLASRGMPMALIIAASLEGAALLFASWLFPVAMVHMSMPVKKRGWLLNKLSKPFFRTVPAIAYWCFFLYLTLLLPLACLAVGGIFSSKGVAQLVKDADARTASFQAQAELESLTTKQEVPVGLADLAKAKPPVMAWSALILPSCLLITAAFLFGTLAPFSMRTNGLYGRYFMDRLDLETMTVEVTYVPKAKNLNELDEKARQLSWQPVLMGLGLGGTAAVVLGGSLGMTFLAGMLQGVTYGLLLFGVVATLTGVGWLIMGAFQKKSETGPTAKFAAAVLATGLVFGGAGAALYLTQDFTKGPSGPGSQEAPAPKGKRGK